MSQARSYSYPVRNIDAIEGLVARIRQDMPAAVQSFNAYNFISGVLDFLHQSLHVCHEYAHQRTIYPAMPNTVPGIKRNLLRC